MLRHTFQKISSCELEISQAEVCVSAGNSSPWLITCCHKELCFTFPWKMTEFSFQPLGLAAAISAGSGTAQDLPCSSPRNFRYFAMSCGLLGNQTG